MNLEELQNQIIKESKELGELEAAENERREVVYNDGGEVKYRTIKTNNQERIAQLRFHIMDMKKEVARINDYKEQNKKQVSELSSEDKEQQKIKKTQEEEYRKVTFKKIQKMYKNQSSFSKFCNFINNRKPNWKQIKQYSQEELDFLVSMGMGQSEVQKIHQEYMQQRYNGKIKQTEIDKKIQDSNKKQFNNALSDSKNLQTYLDSQEGRHR